MSSGCINTPHYLLSTYGKKMVIVCKKTLPVLSPTPKQVMFLVVFVCLSVCLFVCPGVCLSVKVMDGFA